MLTNVSSRKISSCGIFHALYFSLYIFLAAPISTAAQEAGPITVTEAVTIALTNNPELKVIQARVESSARTVSVAKMYAYNPEVGYDEGLDRHVGISQTIEWPGKRALREAIAKADLDSAKSGLAGFRVALAAEVRAKFYDLIVARKSVGLRKRQEQLASRVFDTTSNRVARSYAPLTELTTAEAALVLAKRSQRLAQGVAVQVRANLNSLLGRDIDAAIEPTGDLAPREMTVSLENLTEAALKQNADLMAANAQVEKQRLNERLASKSGAPDITIQPFYEKDTTASDEKVGIGISVPLPLWNTSGPKIAAAHAELREAEADLQSKVRTTTANIARAFSAWKTATDDVTAFSIAFEKKIDTELKAAEKRYAEGQLPFLSLLELERTYFDYMEQYYQSLTALSDARAELEKAAGVSLEELQ